MLNIIVAYNKRGVIGKDGKIPWHHPADLKRFKEITMGYPLIMGRKTHESIGKLLPGRTNIILTTQKKYVPLETTEDVYVVHSFASALEVAFNLNENVFVIGGEEIYKLALPFVDRIYVSYLPFNEEKGDAKFPRLIGNWRTATWKIDGKWYDEKHDVEWYIRTRREKE